MYSFIITVLVAVIGVYLASQFIGLPYALLLVAVLWVGYRIELLHGFLFDWKLNMYNPPEETDLL